MQALVQQKHKPFTVGQIGIFAKKTICMNCGYTMRSSKNRGKHYLKCGTKHTAKNACIGAFISVDALEKAIVQELRKMNDNYLDKNVLAQQVSFAENCQVQHSKIIVEISAYEKKIYEYSKGIKDAYMDKVKGIITEEEFLEFTRDFSREKERLEKLLTETKLRLADFETRLQSSDDRHSKIEEYTNLAKLDRLTVETMIDFISIGRKDSKTGQMPIEIHWNF